MSVCVFCGSTAGTDPAYIAAAREFAVEAVRRGIRIVYGGSNVGLMGALADEAVAQKGKIVGVLPRALVNRELAHSGLTELHIVDSMHERKAMMAELSDAFVALPGGLGTFEELFEIWTWGMLRLHSKPYGMLNVAGYYQPLIDFLDHACEQGFVRPAQRAKLMVDTSPGALLDRLGAVTSSSTTKS